MPQIVAFAINMISSGFAYLAANIFTVDTLVSIGLNFVADALLGGETSGGGGQGTGGDVGRSGMFRSSIATRRIIYGEVLVSGPIIFAGVSGDSNEFLHLVIPLADHEVDQIGDIYFDDTRISVNDLNGNGDVIAGDFNASARIKKILGKDSQAADSDLVSEIDIWTTDHRLRGIAYIYVRLFYNAETYPKGIPNIRAQVRGKKVWNPRDTGRSINTSLFISGGQVQIETDDPHGFSTDDSVFIFNHDAGGDIYGEYEITVDDATHFTIEEDLTSSTGAGFGGTAYLMKYSINPVLCRLDYLVQPYGLDARTVEINSASFIAAANVCDEQVELTDDASTFIADADTDIITRDDTTFDIAYGSIVQVSSDDTLPAGLSAATDYYYVRLTRDEFQLAATLANALAGIVINITDAGTGTHTLTRDSQLRYAMDGLVTLDNQPINIINEMITADAGALVYLQGEYNTFSGGATTATIDLNEDDLRGPIEVETSTLRQNMFNAVRGVYVNPDEFWQPTEFPVITNSLYESQDGGFRIFRDLQLSYITNSTRAQRLGKIYLERSRQGITVNMPCKMTALQVSPWSVIRLSIAHLGWTNKEFRVVSWRLSNSGGDAGIDLQLQEEDATAFDWNKGEETTFDHAVNTTLPDLTTAGAPSNLVLNSGTGELFVNGDGTVVTRIRATWTAAQDTFVNFYEIQARNITTGEDYTTVIIVSSDITETFISPVEDGEDYDVRIRSINVRGNKSSFVTVLGHTVAGKTTPPADVTGFSVVQNGDVVVIQWDQVTDLDLAGYEIRYNPGTSVVWGDATPLNKVVRGTQITAASIPKGEQTILIKAFDTSGNESVNATSVVVIITSIRDIIVESPQAPDWPGIFGAYGDKLLLEDDGNLILEDGSGGVGSGSVLSLASAVTSFVKHEVSGRLVPNSLNLASDDDFETFDQFVVDPVPLCIYEAPEQDVFFEDIVRIWSDIQSSLGPGETVGVAAPTLYIDHSEEGSGGDIRAYDGFKIWTIGDVTARYVKQQVRLDTAIGVAYISLFTPTADLLERTEKADAATIAPGGTLITFSREFHNIPAITVTAQGSAGLIATHANESTISFTIHVFDTDGTDVGGVVDWQAIGV